MSDKVSLYIKGKIYEGWKNANITRSVEALAGSFKLTTTDRWEISSDPWQILPGDSCVLKVNGETLITGYVDSVAPSYDSNSHEISISGRDKTCDLVDCSAYVNSFEIRRQNLKGIADILCKPFGIGVIAKGAVGESFASVAIQPGESVFECLDRYAKQRKVAITTDGLGNLVFATVGTGTSHDALVEGVNILQASATLDYTNRFSQYIVKGQAPSTGDTDDAWNEAQNAVESRASDNNIKRYRPLILTAESGVYKSSAQTRAQLEAKKRAGESTEVNITMQGWTQSNGTLWPLNAMSRIKSPLLYLDEDLVIASLAFDISESGTTTQITLKRPDSFIEIEKSKKEKKQSSDSAVGEDWWSEYE